MSSFIRSGLAAMALFAANAASAQTLTSLEPKACKGAPGNAAARKHDHAAVIYDCAGAAGWRIKLTYFGTNVGADFTPAGAQKPVFTLRASYDIGPRIEWRSAAKGAAPHAAIVRLHERLDTQKSISALAVLGVTKNSICLAAIVDPKSSADHNKAAREIADSLKGGLCPPDALKLKGDESDIVRGLIESNQ